MARLSDIGATVMKKTYRLILIFAAVNIFALLLTCKQAAAQPKVDLLVEPARQIIFIGAERKEIQLIARVEQQGLQFAWALDGPGTLAGDATSMGIFYLPPETVATPSARAIMTVSVTNEQGETAAASITFELMPATPAPPPAAIIGSCAEAILATDRTGKLDAPSALKVMRQDTPVYQDAASSAATARTLDFNKNLQLLDFRGTRVQVAPETTLAPLGWVERSALLCSLAPLKGDSGLEQKFYIRTATEIRSAKPTTVKAYPAPDLQDCQNQCREISRFSGYFVFARDEQQRSYLLSETYKLDATARLVGWVSSENGFVWDTAYGLRPKEDLVFPAGTNLNGNEVGGEERTVCAYKDIAAALADPVGACLPILGGDRWFLSEHRIPLLERVEQDGRAFYKVVLPLAGTGAKYDKATGKISIIEPGEFMENPGIASLANMKHVDVMFLIDGTKSMARHLEAVRGSRENGEEGVVQKIITSLQQDDAFKEAQFRFGFRMYRDAYAGAQEFGEGLPLASQCDVTSDAQAQNLRDFAAALDRVIVTDETNEDYAENLFGGLRQAIRDLAPCPQNTKLLFIIGDCGYDADAQRRRGVTPVELRTLVERLKGAADLKNIVTFFLQTPPNPQVPKNPQEYARAYTLFTGQARHLLTQVLGAGRNNEFPNYFLTTDAADVNAKILAGVKQFSNTAVINELVLDLRGGTALQAAIERLKGSAEYNNLPGLFWDLVEQGSCRQLGEQCQQRIYDTIVEGYLPVSEDLVEDVWLKSEDLDAWTNLLRDFDTNQLSGLAGAELRQTFVFALRDALEKVIRKPRYEDTGEPLAVYLKRKGGLPVSDASPLFRYSLEDLLDPDAVPDCELVCLVSWVQSVKQMLNIIYHGDLQPIYNAEKFPGDCPTCQNIPFITGDIKSAPLGVNPDMRYNHSFQKANIYWTPKKFLP